MARRIITHREQVEMLSPWTITAAGIPPVPVFKHKGRGQENPGYGQSSPHQVPEGTTGDWVNEDWRTGDGGSFRSSIRPPMSSDIPHPSELGRVRETDDPEHDPWGVLHGTGVTFEDLVQNHISHHDNMTPEQAYQGRVWYQAAHDATKDLSDKTIGHHGKTVAVMSAYSPKTGWDENVEKGHHFLTHYDGSDPDFSIPGIGSHTDAAKAIYHSEGEGWRDALTGPKRSAFANNILDPSRLREPRQGVADDVGYYDHPGGDWRRNPDQDSTIDTHHVRMSNTPHGADLGSLKYETPAYFGRTVSHKASNSEFDPSYDLHARAAWEATRRINAREPDPAKHLTPKQVQAGAWTKFKADVDAAGKGAGLPEPGVRPKGLMQELDKRKNQDRDRQEVEEEWARKNPLTRPIPRYMKDQDNDFWNDPRRPSQDLRTTPNWHRRSMHEPQGGSWWDSALADWIASHRTPQRSDQVIMEALHVLASAHGIVGRW